MKELTQPEFQAMVADLKQFAAENPLNAAIQLLRGLGVPFEHRRDFRYLGQKVRVLLTEDVLEFPSRPMRATHLSVVSLGSHSLPAALTEEILAAFFPGQIGEPPRSILEAGPQPGTLLTMPSALPGVTQYSVLIPL